MTDTNLCARLKLIAITLECWARNGNPAPESMQKAAAMLRDAATSVMEDGVTRSPRSIGEVLKGLRKRLRIS